MQRHAIGFTVCLCTACGFGVREVDQGADVDFGHQPDYSISKLRGSDPLPDATTLDKQGGIVVPPDRALVRVDLAASAEGYAAAGDRVTEASRVVLDRLAAGDECEGTVIDYPAPTPQGGKQWRGQAVLQLDVALGDLAALDKRQERIAACVSRFEGLGGDPEGPLAGVEVRVSPPFITLDRPEDLRNELLEQAFARLRDVANVAGQPPQFDPAAMRCTSTGDVSILERSLAGVRLVVDLRCEPHFELGRTTNRAPVPPPINHDPNPFPGMAEGM